MPQGVITRGDQAETQEQQREDRPRVLDGIRPAARPANAPGGHGLVFHRRSGETAAQIDTVSQEGSQTA